jgi:type VI secretion system protein ImpK
MNDDKYVKSLVVDNFKDFYESLLICKSLALSEKSSEDKTIPQQILIRLQDILKSQYNQMKVRGGALAALYYQDAQYAMAALADETFINLPWKGKEDWENNLLESHLYSTQDAGDQFFKKLDAFLATRDHTSIDIAMVYLLTLGLGFQGKFRGEKNAGTLAQYKQSLYNLITGTSPHFEEVMQKFFPQAYEFTLTPRAGSKAPSSQVWYLILASTVGFFILAFYVLWYVEVRDLYTLIDSLRALIRAES